jgi:hypothetical protein
MLFINEGEIVKDRSGMRSLANQADDSKPNRKERGWAFLFLAMPLPLHIDAVI